MKTTPLGEVLLAAPGVDWSASLYLPPETRWDPHTASQIVKTDRYTLEPLEAVAPGLVRVASLGDANDAVLNARAQVADPSAAQLVEALRYFLTRDAFITFKK